MQDRYQKANDAIVNYGRKLEAIYQTHGREGLRAYSGADICVLYWCIQNDVQALSNKIENGMGQESDLLRKQQLSEHLRDLHVSIIEKSEERERGVER